jgi:hypothetical protein
MARALLISPGVESADKTIRPLVSCPSRAECDVFSHQVRVV